MNNKGADQTARMRRLVCAHVVRKPLKTCLRPIYIDTRVLNPFQGITFQEFKQFCQFMNSLDDFTIAMNMYTYAEQPVSRGKLLGKK